MELCRALETALRLVPSTSPRCVPSGQQSRIQLHSQSSVRLKRSPTRSTRAIRTYTSTPFTLAQAAAVKEEDQEDSPQDTRKAIQSSAQQAAPSQGTSYTSQTSEQKPRHRSQTRNDDLNNQISSLMGSDYGRRKPTTTRTRETSLAEVQELANWTADQKQSGSLNLNFLDPIGTSGVTEFKTKPVSSPELRPFVPDTSPPPMRLGPSLGRSIEVIPGRNQDLGRALQMLGMVCARNRVRADATLQKFHERPGLKRKRLKSVRWRRRFKQNFQAVVRRVEEMRRKGW